VEFAIAVAALPLGSRVRSFIPGSRMRENADEKEREEKKKERESKS